MTQQEVADRLVQMDPDLDYTRTSVQRIETGNQRPSVVVLEAMVVMFGAPNLSAMLDRTPEEAEALQKIEALEPKEVRRLLRLLEAGRDEGA
jgi:transcriptional regulator with XRE-family HTH domain